MNRALFTIVAVLLVTTGVAIWYGAEHKIKTDMEDAGYTNVELSIALWNRHPISCYGKHPTIKTYSAVKDGKSVTGFACAPFVFSNTTTWDD